MKLNDSYSQCERIAKQSGSNFYRSFALLRPERHRAMLALYAFARVADDAADEALNSHWAESRWHYWVDELTNIHADTSNNINRELGLIRPALVDAMRRFAIPMGTLHDIVGGVGMDMVPSVRFTEWEQTRIYCERVASSVGIACLSIWSDAMNPIGVHAVQAARDCGIAFQLTNILRDISEDAGRDRIYLPIEELQRFQIDPVRWLGIPKISNAFTLNEIGDWRGLLRLQIERAKAFFESGWNVSKYVSDDGLRMFSLMWHTYRQLLANIERNPVALWQRRVQISRYNKIHLFALHAYTPFFRRFACMKPRSNVCLSQVKSVSERSWPKDGPNVAIVGGGLAGASAAMHLARHGCRVTLFESKSRLGGRVGSFLDTHGQWIDYCQHVGMHCCKALSQWIDDTNQRPFWSEQSTLHFVSQKGKVIPVTAWPLPAPLHLSGLLFRWPQLSWIDRIRIGSGLIKLLRLRQSDFQADTLAIDWLRANGQSEQCIKNFWATILVSALGEQLPRVTLGATHKVLVDGFAAYRDAFHLLVPNRSLSTLMQENVTPALLRSGVQLKLTSTVRQIVPENDQGVELILHTTPMPPANVNAIEPHLSNRVRFDAAICAVPWYKIDGLLTLNENEQPSTINPLQSSPITGIHTWWDRPWLKSPHVILIDRLCQWVFAAPQIDSTNPPETATRSGEHYYQIVISGSRDLPKGDNDALLKLVKQDLAEVFPSAAVATMIRGKVVTDPKAVFSVSPGYGVGRLKADAYAEIGVWLAGDWCDTGWPATMEGALLSGAKAAQELLKTYQRPADFS